MISSRQIKAARALLGWTQTELAKAAGLHLNAITKIENESCEPRSGTLDRIQRSCEIAGIKFRGQRGVEIKEDVFETVRFEGEHFIRRLIDDTITVVNGPEDEVLNCVVDEQFFNVADRKQNERYYKHMKKTGFRERYITSKGYVSFVNNKNVYRWLPDDVLGIVAYTIYRDRIAFIQWKTREVLIIRSTSLSTTFRQQFEFLWTQAKPYKS
ncbi:MAG: XRE family transcriptional regulator [Alphaproteobacteria bacterium]|nr:XRE family transcriptional regulator [Alphaproteobacteria bacterium]